MKKYAFGAFPDPLPISGEHSSPALLLEPIDDTAEAYARALAVLGEAVGTDDGETIRRICTATTVANARLIAAAPDMLAALRDALELAKLVNALTGGRGDDDYVWGLEEKFKSVIARATGEAAQ